MPSGMIDFWLGLMLGFFPNVMSGFFPNVMDLVMLACRCRVPAMAGAMPIDVS